MLQPNSIGGKLKRTAVKRKFSFYLKVLKLKIDWFGYGLMSFQHRDVSIDSSRRRE